MTDDIPSIEVLSSRFDRVLTDALAFSNRHKLSWFGKSFQAGKAALHSTKEPDLGEIALKGQLPLPASKLMVAVQKSWVFGGMGSWNDLFYEGEEDPQYETISNEMYEVSNAALIAAANTSFPQN